MSDRAPASEEAALAREVIQALGHGDVGAFAELLDPEVEIHTARGVHRGRDAAEEWARKRYEHLERRYAIDELRRQADGTILAFVRTQYVWRESGLVGDEAPSAIELGFRAGKLVHWRFREDLAPVERG